MAHTLDKSAEWKKEEAGRYGEGNAEKRGESPSPVRNPADGRSARSREIKSAATAYRKMSENDTNAVGRR